MRGFDRSDIPVGMRRGFRRPGSTLADYRARHAQYKTDPALQTSHAAFPWIVTWDDHEVENNYAGLVDEVDDTGARHQDPQQFARQRAAAYQAYYEHMPLRRTPVPRSTRRSWATVSGRPGLVPA
jgi:phosphodiesterase/alkaline phosphatase D-like protein